MKRKRSNRRRGATDAASVLDKIAECKYFLRQMMLCENGQEIANFRHNLSAFLSALRTVSNRLIGVISLVKGELAGESLWAELKSHPEVWFLRESTNVEIHSDGVKLRVHYKLGFSSYEPRFSRPSARFQSNFKSRHRYPLSRIDVTGKLPVNISGKATHIDGHPKKLLVLCSDALREMESVVQEQLSSTKQSGEVL